MCRHREWLGGYPRRADVVVFVALGLVLAMFVAITAALLALV